MAGAKIEALDEARRKAGSRERFASKNFDQEILEALQEGVRRSRPGPANWRVLVNSSPDLPEQRSLALLIMPPDFAYSENNGQERLLTSDVEQRLLDLSQKGNSRDRLYRHTLLFLLPSPRRLSRLRSALWEAAALEALEHDYGGRLDGEQREELRDRIASTRMNANDVISSAYTYVARIDGQKLAVSEAW